MLRYILFFTLLLTSVATQAQTLYMSRNVKQAFDKGTRSADGRPGKNYWQNTGKYNIKVSATPPNRTVNGREEISYTNNSNDTLKRVVIKLILNIHKPGALRYGDVDSNYLTSGLHIDELQVNGEVKPWIEPANHVTWQRINLAKPLLPHDSVRLRFRWHFDLSKESNREGVIDSTTFFLAYFYPRVAVYDDYNGWDTEPFTDSQEFYNDFNDYTLKVEVPKNYVVWATGTLQNPLEVLQPEYAERLSNSTKQDSTQRIASLAELLTHKVTTQNPTNTWVWKASHITDMTLALSNHYVWDAASVVVDDATQRRASVQAAYNDTAKDYHHMVGYARHALDWLSHNWPGVPYPFEKSTVVQGFADMEYPMMVNDGTEDDLNFARFVVEHEIAHTYFPFYMGINENRFGFMDEGWATTFELLIGRADVGMEKAEELYKNFRVNRWIHDPSAEEDLPIITPANTLRGVAYGNNAYGKPSLGYLAVKDLLGDELFKKCLQGYMERWHGRHPIPWDFFNSFNDIAGRNLNWFWNSWYFSNGYIDLAIQDAKKTKIGYTVLLENIGGFPAPVNLIVTYADSTTETFHQTPEIWHVDLKRVEVKITTQKVIKSLKIEGGIFMDADEKNNILVPVINSKK